MVHNFELVRHANGNSTVYFYENNKRREIKFIKDSEAQRSLELSIKSNNLLVEHNYVGMVSSESEKKASLQFIISQMKSRFRFVKNDKNPSIFRPITK